jgi:hypothetical protein
VNNVERIAEITNELLSKANLETILFDQMYVSLHFTKNGATKPYFPLATTRN